MVYWYKYIDIYYLNELLRYFFCVKNRSDWMISLIVLVCIGGCYIYINDCSYSFLNYRSLIKWIGRNFDYYYS